jgi:hypothetical protein
METRALGLTVGLAKGVKETGLLTAFLTAAAYRPPQEQWHRVHSPRVISQGLAPLVRTAGQVVTPLGAHSHRVKGARFHRVREAHFHQVKEAHSHPVKGAHSHQVKGAHFLWVNLPQGAHSHRARPDGLEERPLSKAGSETQCSGRPPYTKWGGRISRRGHPPWCRR